jgi:hypothetical protein
MTKVLQSGLVFGNLMQRSKAGKNLLVIDIIVRKGTTLHFKNKKIGQVLEE